LRSNNCANPLANRFDIPRLDANEGKIHGADVAEIVCDLDRPNKVFSAISFNPQPVLAHGREVGTARNQSDIDPGFQERCSQGTANSARPDDCDMHLMSPYSV
jgi:hypothetical protein